MKMLSNKMCLKTTTTKQKRIGLEMASFVMEQRALVPHLRLDHTASQVFAPHSHVQTGCKQRVKCATSWRSTELID